MTYDIYKNFFFFAERLDKIRVLENYGRFILDITFPERLSVGKP